MHRLAASRESFNSADTHNGDSIMKIKHIAMVMAAALLTVGLIPAGSAQSDFGSAQAGIEVITVVGKRPTQEGIEVITVVGKRPAPTVASTCVNEVRAARVSGNENGSDYTAQAVETRRANWNSVRQAIKDCIEQAQIGTSHS
jgi:hypothetical protein